MGKPCDRVGRASAACSVFGQQVALVRRGFACSQYLAPAIRRIVRYAGLPSGRSHRVPSTRKTRHDNRRREASLVLRFMPLLFGIGALFLFSQVARACLSRGAAPLAVLLFAINEPLIYYSSEVKQYSCDVAITSSCCGLSCVSCILKCASVLFVKWDCSARQASGFPTLPVFSSRVQVWFFSSPSGEKVRRIWFELFGFWPMEHKFRLAVPLLAARAGRRSSFGRFLAQLLPSAYILVAGNSAMACG